MTINYVINANIDNAIANQITQTFISVGFGNAYEDEEMIKLFKNSEYHCLAMDHGQVVGLIRVLSDDVLTSWVTEIIVRPEYQRKGIGTRLLKDYLNRFSHTARYVDSFPGDCVSFFVKNGMPVRENLVSCALAPE